MKKLLAIMSAVGLTATASTAVVSCGTKYEKSIDDIMNNSVDENLKELNPVINKIKNFKQELDAGKIKATQSIFNEYLKMYIEFLTINTSLLKEGIGDTGVLTSEYNDFTLDINNYKKN